MKRERTYVIGEIVQEGGDKTSSPHESKDQEGNGEKDFKPKEASYPSRIPNGFKKFYKDLANPKEEDHGKNANGNSQMNYGAKRESMPGVIR